MIFYYNAYSPDHARNCSGCGLVKLPEMCVTRVLPVS